MKWYIYPLFTFSVFHFSNCKRVVFLLAHPCVVLLCYILLTTQVREFFSRPRAHLVGPWVSAAPMASEVLARTTSCMQVRSIVSLEKPVQEGHQAAMHAGVNSQSAR